MSKTRAPRIGDRIRHPDWGAGKVLGLVRGGRMIRVEFDEMAGAPWEIPRDELKNLSPEGPPEVSSRQEKNKVPIEDGRDPVPTASKDRQEAGKVAAHKVNQDAESP
jgi:hypothetical protein